MGRHTVDKSSIRRVVHVFHIWNTSNPRTREWSSMRFESDRLPSIWPLTRWYGVLTSLNYHRTNFVLLPIVLHNFVEKTSIVNPNVSFTVLVRNKASNFIVIHLEVTPYHPSLYRGPHLYEVKTLFGKRFKLTNFGESVRHVAENVSHPRS